MNSAVLGALAVMALGLAVRPQPPTRSLAVAPTDGERRVPAIRLWSGQRHRRRRTADVNPHQLAAWCEEMARAIRSGSTFQSALCNVAAPPVIDQHMQRARLAIERGSSTRRALDAVPAVSAHLDLVLVVLRACADHGGPAAEPIDRAAAALRQRAALIAERRSHSAQARASAIVMTVLPSAVLILLTVSSGSVRQALLSPAGAAVVAIGLALNGAGWSWMRRILRSTW